MVEESFWDVGHGGTAVWDGVCPWGRGNSVGIGVVLAETWAGADVRRGVG